MLLMYVGRMSVYRIPGCAISGAGCLCDVYPCPGCLPNASVRDVAVRVGCYRKRDVFLRDVSFV